MSVWVMSKPIPRANGESTILYIGKTDASLAVRKGYEVQRELPNFSLYRQYFDRFGEMRVLVRECQDPKEAESSLVAEYRDAHWEEPPLNRTSR